MKYFSLIAILLFSSLNLKAQEEINEITTMEGLVDCVERFSLNEIAKDDFFMWEHQPKYWKFRKIFGGWLTNSGGSNQYVEIDFDEDGVATEILQCGINTNDKQTYGRCQAIVKEGYLKLRWFWFDPPYYVVENPGKDLDLVEVKDFKIKCIAK